DGVSTAPWTAAEMVARLGGEDRAPVVLGVQAPGSTSPRRVRLVRVPIQVPSVPHAYLTRDGVGYVDLPVVAETSADELAAAVQRLKAQGMRGLVLDLRGNPGGLLEQGVAVASLFLARGRVVVETRGRDARENESFAAGAPEAFPRLPLVVLVDGGTASAAEIVAGALQDHDRALVVGAPSYGKGSVQTLFPLSGGSFLKLTTARWYTPAGRSIQKDRAPEGEGSVAVADAVEASGRPDAPASGTGGGRRIVYRTDGGRVVYGGGGIVPDVVVAPDTVDAEARPFLAAAAARGDALDEAIFAYGVELARGRPELPRGFAVSRAMLTELQARLRGAGIDASEAEYRAAEPLLARRLAHQVTLARWGAAEAARRDAEGDAVLREAVRLLRASSTQAELLRAPPASSGSAPSLALH
ncbi:MAG TPA: S41 family peptidase, partial [Longimicrobiaceae bacterium]|nr:S41 family peptidase [Longimicrobiaceae bacterium]